MKVGFFLPAGADAPGIDPPSYVEMRDLALRAEAAGFDSVWIADHLLFRSPSESDATHLETTGIWECWTLLSALAEATSRVELGQLVMCVPFREPSLLAKMAVTLDEVSGGRVILGLGAGWHAPEFDAFGVHFDHLASRFEEAVQIIGPLLREGHVNFEGQYYFAKDSAILPRGPRPGGPPLLIAATGPRMLRIAAREADLWNWAWFGRPEAIATQRTTLATALAELGRDPGTLQITVGVDVSYPLPGEEPLGPDRALTGSPEEIAHGLLAFRDAGVAHAICAAMSHATYDFALGALERVAAALPIYRELAGEHP
jgi:alkanesulfonate monooxygenase SsuD/methylene tetrahydromethanopterin reductase-like flavin-dependent oxidoreductase (luciferase family)